MLKPKPILLSPPHFDESELSYITEAMKSPWIASGENIGGFENDLAKFLGKDYPVALNSGTSAIHLALIMLNVQRDDELLCQSFTFSASANPITYVGAKPVVFPIYLQQINLFPAGKPSKDEVSFIPSLREISKNLCKKLVLHPEVLDSVSLVSLRLSKAQSLS